jgi:hypothetical protein
VLQAIKLLRDEGSVSSCRYVYCNRNPSGRSRALLLPVKLEAPSSRWALVWMCGSPGPDLGVVPD